VTALYRYPVKSLQGLAPSALHVRPDGVDGDRQRGLVDGASGRLLSAKRHSALLHGAADDDGITLPGGSRADYGDPDVDEVLSAWLGHSVELHDACTATDMSYEMTFDPPDDDADYVAIPTPTGTFLDLSPLHLVSRSTLDGCAARHPELDWNVRRFRPNLVVDGLDEPFAEDGWCGRRVRIGSVVASARQPTVRCAMPLRAQPGLDRQAGLFAALDALHRYHLGIYLDVVEPGEIRVGDDVRVEGPADA